MYLCRAFLDFGNLTFFRKSWILGDCGATPWGVIVLPKKSTCFTPKWHLDIVSLSPALRMHLKTSVMFVANCSALFAAMPMSSTYCAHWSAFITESRYSLIKLENADKDLLSPWANRL